MVCDTRSFLLVLALFLVGTLGGSGTGWASCFGSYPSVLSPNSVVESGIGSYIAGEDWTYTTALCSTWANTFAGACVQVSCVQGGAGASGGINCLNSKTTYVRVIDQLGNDCSGSPPHVFDLNDVAFNQLASDGASCSGSFAVSYSGVSCQTAGLVSGGIKIGIAPNQCDPYCPSFVFSNVGGSGALSAVSVSPDGVNWYAYKRNSAEGARWDCQGGQGLYLGKSLSFKFTGCSETGIFAGGCVAGEVVTSTNALPSSWCGASGSPCTATSYQASNNLGQGSTTPTQPTPPPTQPTPPPTQPTTPPTKPTPPTSQPTPPPSPSTNPNTRCGPDWTTANGACKGLCTVDGDCTNGDKCWANLASCSPTTPVTPPTAPAPPPTTPVSPPTSTTKPSTSSIRCGATWTDANNNCYGTTCATNGDCASGTSCFKDLTVCSASSALAETSTETNQANPGLTPAQIAGIAVASVVLVAIVVAAFFVFRRRPAEEIV